MTARTFLPKLVKILYKVYTDYGMYQYVDSWTITIGTYYIAEHSKTSGLKKGDKFIIKEIYNCLTKL